jgi:nicotinamidase/pyrazinamidase
VEDALRYHYMTFVLTDAIRAIDANSNLSRTLEEMKRLGAIPVDFESLGA